MGKGGLCGFLAAVCLVSLLTGCHGGSDLSTPPSADLSTDTPVADTGTGLQSMALAYSKEDTLNPFATKTEANLQLATLLYDSLTVLDDAFQPVNSLAAKVERKDATHLVVTLKKNAKFSNGKKVSPGDVVASFRQAKASANYKVLLSNVTAAVADNNKKTVTFALTAADPGAEACLSFPVIKESTLTSEKGKAPIGGGLYKLESDEDGARLTYNKYSGLQTGFNTVELHHLPNTDTMHYGLSSGSITYYFNDLGEGDIPRLSGAGKAVDMNALVYLGANSVRKTTGNTAVRLALSASIDRQVLTQTGYSGYGIGSASPLHPAYGPVEELKRPTPNRDLTGAVDALKEAGYEEKTLELELIYPKGNQALVNTAKSVQDQCRGAGVNIKLTPLKYKEYVSRLKAGTYDLYVGEVRLAANMSLAPLLPGGGAGYGVAKNNPAVTAYAAYLAGEKTLEEFLAAFEAELPFIPLCWRCGIASYDRRLSTVTPTGYNVYAGFGEWK